MKKPKLSSHTIGIILVITDSFFFSLMTLFVKLAGDVPTMQKTFFRNFIAAIIAITVLARSEEKFHIKKGSLPGLFARSIFGGVGMILNFWAISIFCNYSFYYCFIRSSQYCRSSCSSSCIYRGGFRGKAYDRSCQHTGTHWTFKWLRSRYRLHIC